MMIVKEENKGPLLVINWKPTPQFQMLTECVCGQPSYTSQDMINNMIEKYGAKPRLICVVCALKKYKNYFTRIQILDMERYYKEITN